MEGGRRGRGRIREAGAGPLGRSCLEAQWLALAGRGEMGGPAVRSAVLVHTLALSRRALTPPEGTVGPHWGLGSDVNRGNMLRH